MASYTQEDITNAGLFANRNLNSRLINKLYEKAPHLTSHLLYTERDATLDDYYIPPSIKSLCKVLDIKISRNLCEKLSCVSSKEKELCKPEDKASYFIVGMDDYDVQCQPACFNLKDEGTFNDNGQRVADTLETHFFEDECRFVNPSATNYLLKPFYRSDKVYEARVNNFQNGYTRKEGGHFLGDGYVFENNKSYCDYFNLSISSNLNCKEPWYMSIATALLGTQFLNYTRALFSGEVFTGIGELKLNITDPRPDTVDSKYSVENWKKDIDDTFKLPEIIDYENLESDEPEKINFDELSERQKIELNLILNKTKSTRDLPEELLDDLGEKFKELGTFMKEMILGILNAVFTEEFWEIVALNVGAAVALNYVKKLALSFAEKFTSEFLANTLVRFASKLGSKVLEAGMKSLVREGIVKISLKIVSKLAQALASLIASTATIILSILEIAQWIDLIFLFWDPLGYSNVFPGSIAGDAASAGLVALKRAAGSAKVNLDFDNLVYKLLTQTEIQEIYLSSLNDTVFYLNNLIVNSEGSVIYKGEAINYGGVQYADQLAADVTGQKISLLTSDIYTEDNKVLLNIVNFQSTLRKISLALSFASIVFLYLKTQLFCLFCLFISLLLLYCSFSFLYSEDLYVFVKSISSIGNNYITSEDNTFKI